MNPPVRVIAVIESGHAYWMPVRAPAANLFMQFRSTY